MNAPVSPLTIPSTLSTPHANIAPKLNSGAILTFGFGTAVAMWGIGYVGRLPGAHLPAAALFGLIVAALLGGGFFSGRWVARGISTGVLSGVVCGTINLLILGSLLKRDAAQGIDYATLWWIPGSLVLSGFLSGVGALVGRIGRIQPTLEPAWDFHFATVTAGATLILLAVGGVVTGYGAGLAVVDWPNTFGNMMFLYPLAHMTGGIYYEHAHRLFGSLVGLTTLVFAIYLQCTPHRFLIRALGWIAVVAVIVQGVMGGLRVTGRLTMSTAAAEVSPNLALAVVHGVFAQVFFSLLAVLRVLLWTERERAALRPQAPSSGTDSVLTGLLVGAILVQLALGAALRHFGWGLVVHLTFAALVLSLAVGAGTRALGVNRDRPGCSTSGLLLLLISGLQLVLGGLAIWAVADGKTDPQAWQVIITTAHQTNGALMLATAVTLATWYRIAAPLSHRAAMETTSPRRVPFDAASHV